MELGGAVFVQVTEISRAGPEGTGGPLPFQHLLPLDTPYLWPLLQIGWENVWKNSPGLLWLVKEAARSLFSFLSSDFILFIKSIWREEGKGSGPWGTSNF